MLYADALLNMPYTHIHRRLNPQKCDLVDDAGHHWPNRALVKDALETFQLVRVSIAMRLEADIPFDTRFKNLSESQHMADLRTGSPQETPPPELVTTASQAVRVLCG